MRDAPLFDGIRMTDGNKIFILMLENIYLLCVDKHIIITLLQR